MSPDSSPLVNVLMLVALQWNGAALQANRSNNYNSGLHQTD